ncbi:hypothetical protein [Rickettsia conorii]|uniref:hypothetical protein n=1 Tax=Rickettsia conorii TaxID=781 RepID=UPI002B401A60|nr:hypothetical protein [Rickettsia conorii]
MIYCDFNIDLTPQSWINRLNNIDIVINVSGVLTSSHAIILTMFMSMVQRLYLRLVPLLTYKELFIIDWVILQPSLVYASGCYGGTSLFRALATLPYFIPLIGDCLQ